MDVTAIYVAIFFALLLSIPIVSVSLKAKLTAVGTLLLALFSSIPALQALSGNESQLLLEGLPVTGEVLLKVDALSGWFMLLINFTFLTGLFYGLYYMQSYADRKASLSLHAVAFLLCHASLLSICVVQNGMAFLLVWEIMALSTFLLVIFEHSRPEILKAGINFLIQSHISLLFLMLGVMWVAAKTDSFSFYALSRFCSAEPALMGTGLFFTFFVGFAIKAGFVPFHTWLPYAHPAAPAHISGIMSGVIIKIGIYGMLRMLLLCQPDFTTVGVVLLGFSVLSGMYGVMLALIQHNLKRLLAYHSIENIGIIGMGIGLGCIGLGSGSETMAILGFSGALLHTLNHALFKSLLFYAAGTLYKRIHSVEIDRLGGLSRSMPHTTLLFLLASLAICGLPPFNGFVSEFLIYKGLFAGFLGDQSGILWLFIFSVVGLVAIGGMALFCFTKAFGTIFLGLPRTSFSVHGREPGRVTLPVLYTIVGVMLLIGLMPTLFAKPLFRAVSLFFSSETPLALTSASLSMPLALQRVGLSAAAFLLVLAAVWVVRRWRVGTNLSTSQPTWGCGYEAPNARLQYTASSYVRSFRKLAAPLLVIHKKKKDPNGFFPTEGARETHPYDKVESVFVDIPLRWLHRVINRFSFLQNGNLQFYIIYGLVFVALVLFLPVFFEKLALLIRFLNGI